MILGQRGAANLRQLALGANLDTIYIQMYKSMTFANQWRKKPKFVALESMSMLILK